MALFCHMQMLLSGCSAMAAKYLGMKVGEGVAERMGREPF